MNEVKDLRTGDVISCMYPMKITRAKRYISALIRLFTQSMISHTAMVIKISGEVFVIESDIGGVNLICWKDWVKKGSNGEIIVFRPSDVSYSTISKRALSKVGHTRYDYMSLLYQIYFQITGKWRGYTVERYAEKSFYCSEFVAWVHELKDWYKLTPNKVVEGFKGGTNVYVGKASSLI